MAIRRICCAACVSSRSCRRSLLPTPTGSGHAAVDLTAAALGQIEDGHSGRAGGLLRDAMRVLFPEAEALVSAARQGFMRE